MRARRCLSGPGTLVLRDVDLTLVRTGPIGRELYAEAFERVTGRPMRLQAALAGRLDPDIFRDTVAANDLDPADHPFPAFAESLAAAYASRFDQLRAQGRALPGAASALAALASKPAAVQTVLIGNVRPVAAIKLAAFGLDRYGRPRHRRLRLGGCGAGRPGRYRPAPGRGEARWSSATRRTTSRAAGTAGPWRSRL